MDFNFTHGTPKSINDDNPISPMVITHQLFDFVLGLAKEKEEEKDFPPYNQSNAFNVLSMRLNAMHALFRLAEDEKAYDGLKQAVAGNDDINMLFHDQTVVLNGEEIRKSLGNIKHIAQAMSDMFQRRAMRADTPEGGFMKMQNTIKEIDDFASEIGIDILMPTSLIGSLVSSVMQHFPGPDGPKGGGRVAA